MVIKVSSMVLFTRVSTLDTKKLMAPSKASPFLHRSFCVSALYPNSSCRRKKQTKKHASFYLHSSFPRQLTETHSLRFSTCNSGDFWLRSVKVSPRACCVCTMLWKWLMRALANLKMFSYLLLVSLNTSIWASSSRSTVREPRPNLSENICFVHCAVSMNREFIEPATPTYTAMTYQKMYFFRS